MFLFKIIIAPVLIGLVSLAGRKWGPGVSGWLLGIPINGGPILLFFALEQGPEFAARAALGALLGMLAWGTFNLVYAWCCLRWRWWWCTLAGWIACCFVAWALTHLEIGVLWAYALVCAVLALISQLFPRPPAQTEEIVHSRYELWLRMAGATAFIVTLTAIARFLGPRVSGVFSSFPAFTTILAIFNQRLHPAAAVRVLKGVSAGLFTAGTFFVVVALALTGLGIFSAFSVAIVAALLVQAASFAFVRTTE